MHAVFIPYGIKSCVEHLLADMQAQKYKWRFYKKKEPDKFLWTTGSLRILPFGIYEYVFPKEDKDIVLTTLGFHNPSPKYDLGKARMFILRKILNVSPIPEFKTDQHYLWIKQHVSIIPIGIREDVDMTEIETESKGWSHEEL